MISNQFKDGLPFGVDERCPFCGKPLMPQRRCPCKIYFDGRNSNQCKNSGDIEDERRHE